MEIDLTQLKAITNKKFMPEYDCRDRYLVFYGGGNSGKSHFCATKIVARCLLAEAEGFRHKFLVTRKTQPAVRKSAFELVKTKIELFGLPRRAVKINKTMLEIRIYHQLIMFAGLDDPEKIKSIEGVTSTWEEEPTELKRNDHTQLDLRLRGFKEDYMQMMLSLNPIDEQNWINVEFFTGLDNEDRPRDDFSDVTPKKWPKYKKRVKFTSIVDGEEFSNYATTIHSTVDDNRWATREEKAVLEALKFKDPNYYKVYRKGEWGVLKGLIFDRWDECREWPKKFDISGYGLDFGFTNHPSAMVHAGIIGDNLYLKEEFYEKGLTNADIADRMADIIDEETGWATVADCAEPKSIAELCRAGLFVLPCKKGKDSIVHGIQTLKQYNIHVHPESVNLIKELRAYKWAVDKNDKPTNKPVDYLNHLLDAARYIVTHLVGHIDAGIESIGGDPKEERKEELQAEEYSPELDDDLYEDFG